MSVKIRAFNVAGVVTLVISSSESTTCMSLAPGAAIEACGDIARAAADAEVWAERVQERIEQQRALATVGCAVCASFGRGCCRDHQGAAS